MTGAAVPAGAPVAAGAGRLAVAIRERAGAIAIELALFSALAAFGMAQWARLVEPQPTADLMLSLAVVCVAATGLSALAGLRPGIRRTLLALAVAAAGLCAALVAAGLPAHLLEPAHWGEFRDEVQNGVGGIEQAQLPYDGADEWIRRSLVLGAPALVALAAAVAFWPGGRPGRRRVVALAILLIVYGVGATLDNPGAEILWGLALLLLSVAWLWVARLGAGRRIPALVVALAAGVLALPLAARLNAEAWWDYENWSWFGAERSVEFEWNHEYGPLDWPREGTTLMTVQTETPLYWKASVLDRFDGYTWSRAVSGDPTATAELGARSIVPGGTELDKLNPGWVEEATFELRALSSELVIGAGVTRDVDGASALASDDGTLTHVGDSLERGDEYSIRSYVPQPTPEQLRDAPVASSVRRFSGTTLIGLPTSVESPVLQTLAMPLWGSSNEEAEAALLASPYGEVYRLAQQWTAGAETPYEAVRAVQEHLRGDFDYTPTVPESSLPLVSFLFEDEAGYCQQFAGSMGLMLRMLGIPARVVSGFAPGARDAESGAYEVRDFDAHSWVEVYFRGIGWVTFDPTPGVAPAERPTLGGDVATGIYRSPENLPLPESTGGFRRGDAEQGGSAPLNQGISTGGIVGLVLLTMIVVGGAVWTALAWRRRAALARGERVDEQVDELAAALRRVGWELKPGATLMAIEHRAEGHSRKPVREYAARLRRHRYGPTATAPPGPRERRALRRALAGDGIAGRVRALLAIPPGGPAGA